MDCGGGLWNPERLRTYRISFLLFAKKSPKIIAPTHTSFYTDATDETAVTQNVTMQPQTARTPSTGFLPFLFALFLPNFSEIVEEVLFMAVMEVVAER